MAVHGHGHAQGDRRPVCSHAQDLFSAGVSFTGRGGAFLPQALMKTHDTKRMINNFFIAHSLFRLLAIMNATKNIRLHTYHGF